MSLVNLCLDIIGRVLKKPSNVYQLRGILPDSLLQDLSVFIYSHLDPRTTMDYFAMHREYTDDIAESGIESLLNHNFSLYNNPFSADIFWILDWDTLVNFEMFTDSEYYEFQFHRYYLLETSKYQKIWSGYYCGNCIKEIVKIINEKDYVWKNQCVITYDRSELIDELITRENYCYNCFVTPCFTFVPCDGNDYVDIPNHRAVCQLE